MRNFEEHWEVESSIREIEKLNEENLEKIEFLSNALDEANENQDSIRSKNLESEIVALRATIE
jgi:hypothetical protein